MRRPRLLGVWDEIYSWFQYRGRESVVWEPCGDSSRYWIDQQEGSRSVDLSELEGVFRRCEPPQPRKVLDLLTPRVLKVLGRRMEDWRATGEGLHRW